MEGASTPGTALRPTYRDNGMAGAVDGWNVDIADLVGSAMRRLLLDRDGVAALLQASIAAWLLPQYLPLLTRRMPSHQRLCRSSAAKLRRFRPYHIRTILSYLSKGAGAVRTPRRQNHTWQADLQGKALAADRVARRPGRAQHDL